MKRGAKRLNIRHGHGPRRGCNAVEKAIETQERRRGKAEVSMQDVIDNMVDDLTAESPITVREEYVPTRAEREAIEAEVRAIAAPIWAEFDAKAKPKR